MPGLGVFLGLNVLVKVDVCVCPHASPSLCMKSMCLDEGDCIARGECAHLVWMPTAT